MFVRLTDRYLILYQRRYILDTKRYRNSLFNRHEILNGVGGIKPCKNCNDVIRCGAVWDFNIYCTTVQCGSE